MSFSFRRTTHPISLWRMFSVDDTHCHFWCMSTVSTSNTTRMLYWRKAAFRLTTTRKWGNEGQTQAIVWLVMDDKWERWSTLKGRKEISNPHSLFSSEDASPYHFVPFLVLTTFVLSTILPKNHHQPPLVQYQWTPQNRKSSITWSFLMSSYLTCSEATGHSLWLPAQNGCLHQGRGWRAILRALHL